MLAHLFNDNGRWRFSGYNAGGDPFDGAGQAASKTKKPRPFDAIVDVGREFKLTEDGLLYITGPGPHQFTTWTAEGVILAAKTGRFGFKMLEFRA